MDFFETITFNDLKDRPEEFLDSNFSHILKMKYLDISDRLDAYVCISFGKITIADPENPTPEESEAIEALTQPVYAHLFKLFNTGGLFIKSNTTLLPAVFDFDQETGTVWLNNSGLDEFYANGHYFYGTTHEK